MNPDLSTGNANTAAPVRYVYSVLNSVGSCRFQRSLRQGLEALVNLKHVVLVGLYKSLEVWLPSAEPVRSAWTRVVGVILSVIIERKIRLDGFKVWTILIPGYSANFSILKQMSEVPESFGMIRSLHLDLHANTNVSCKQHCGMPRDNTSDNTIQL